MIKLGFQIESDIADGVEIPTPSEFAQHISQALPKEMWSDNRMEDWGVVAVFALNDDGTLMQSDHRLRPTNVTATIRRLTSELEQEKKLTTHLEERIDVRDRQALLLGTKLRQEQEQVSNLTEKNDNQRELLIRVQAELFERTRSLDVSQHEWKVRGEALMNANQEAQNHAAMIHKIVGAMEEAGYDISGWGSDVQLTELETASTQVEDQVQAAAKQIVTLKRFISDAHDQVFEVESSMTEAQAEVDGLDSLLDNIRTER